jgi:transketolase
MNMKTARTLAEYMAMGSAKLDSRSVELRNQIVRILDAGGRGHVGSAFSVVEILRVLYDDVLRFDSSNPKWAERDRCILSKGHGCMALYVFLAEKGFIPESELWKFCKSDGILGGHPSHEVPGVEASTGSLGHGLPIGVGFALNARYEKSDYRTFVILGDGESNEGSVWEAAMCAGKHKLNNLTVLVDYNKHQSYGSTFDIQDMEPFADKWRAFGFAATDVDGHDVDQLRSALAELPFQSDKPSAIICHTIKGKGVEYVENNMEWHHKNRVSEDDINSLITALEAG